MSFSFDSESGRYLMSNINNLIPFTSEQNREEAKKNGRKGGIASGEARRRNKAFKEQIDYFLSLPFPDMIDKDGNKIRDTFKNFGIEEEEIDNQMAMILSMWKSVIKKGDVSAFIALRDTVGEKPADRIKGDLTLSYEEALKRVSSEDEY